MPKNFDEEIRILRHHLQQCLIYTIIIWLIGFFAILYFGWFKGFKGLLVGCIFWLIGLSLIQYNINNQGVI